SRSTFLIHATLARGGTSSSATASSKRSDWRTRFDRMTRRWESLFWPLFAFTTFLCFWYGAVILSHTKVFPGPMAVQRGLLELFRKGLLWNYVRDSLFRVGTGYSLAILFGIPTGLVLGWYPSSAAAVNPLIQILRPISPLAWIPLSIVWFGIGNQAAIFLIFLASFFPVVVAT